MEVDGGGGGEELEKGKTTPEREPKVKRKMKTASQLEILEKTFAMESYPSEAIRAELSVKLGLSDRQLQMWFCHRRLKDRKPPPEKKPRKNAALLGTGAGLSSGAGDEMLAAELGNEHISGSVSGSSPFQHVDSQPRVAHRAGTAVPRIAADMPAVKRYYEPPQAISELRAIAFVEAQLGEPLREDGPILGMEFDPLPPGAFGTPIEQQKPAGRSYESKLFERPEVKPIKGSGRAVVHEYQFLPEQPSVRSDSYERAVPSHYYGSANDAPNARTSLPSGRSLLHGTEAASSGYGFQGHMPSLSLMPPQARQGHLMPSAPAEFEIGLRKQSYPNVALDAQFGTHPITGLENPLIPPDRQVFHEEDASRMERKRKSEEARIAREVEAHEKRIRKELEKQDILRRKREEQMRKEMERQDRERRKEEERLLREKQREEERYLREQRREMERREKFMQKESIRAEKLRLKEEMRREKEAARIKAAHDRAAARRIAKESMEPIDDERLELMEIAAASRGLPSMLALDGETLQDLDLFRDMLVDFPPKSVHLKRPFAIQPWADSEDNTGNLLMVWRFLITFADVIGLWPFTLDEFVQAFHDYDPRLLGEIHVALLRSIIKDIEDVARTPSSGLGANQNSAANPGGGHPQIVEGAYAWGFDIGSWQRHLNPLTWPEILRQFALSAGLGPKLKKRNIEQPYLRDENEGNDGEDIISNLRNGAAVENAVAIMQERGYSNPRRSRHRLTPGTVKFAAFHVLSLEGGQGLTILDVAEKIQKSGLRDLTTSKTPEASIAAALSRDTKLFERTAPSTYCVRAPYRKDPADADAILSAAREKVQVFKNGYLEGEDADDVEKDDAEREEDSDSDAAEDPEIDDLGTESKPKKEALIPCSDSRSLVKISTSDEKDGANRGLIENPQVGSGDLGRGLALMQSDGLIDVKNDRASVVQSLDIAGAHKVATNLDQEESVIDESNSGEPWVQGLMEGEYSDLSVEERLNALVSLIGEANEGNSIRIVLEERLEAANALKKQMWAEAQLDKRRMKEYDAVKMQYPSFYSNKAEQNPATNTIEGRQSPLLAVNEKNYLTSNSPAVPPEHLFDQQVDPNYSNNMSAERNIPIQDSPAGPDNFSLLPSGCVAEKSRPQFKAFIGHKAEEMYVYRSLPLGQDRRRNRYWQFMTSASRNDPGSGRIFIELHDGCWRLIDSEEAFDALLASLDVRGIRESHLHLMLQKIETSFKETVKKNMLCPDGKNLIRDIKTDVSERACDTDWNANTDSPSSSVCLSNSEIQETSSSFRIGHGRNSIEKNDALKRYLDFEKWMWEDCYDSSILCAKKYGKTRCKQLLNICNHCHDTYLFGDHHCSFCHRTYNASISRLNFSEHVTQCKDKLRRAPDGVHPTLHSCFPLRIRLLKAHLAAIEVSIPAEALEPSWSDDYRKFWIAKLQTASSAEELLRILTLLEGAIRRDFLLPNYETTSELLGSSEPTRLFSDSSIGLENLMVLPWVPLTTSAVTLRLLELDSSICYVPDLKAEYEKKTAAGAFLTPPSKYAIVMNNPEDELAQMPAEAQTLQQEPWGFSGSVQVNSGQGGGRGRGRGCTRGGKSQKKVKSSRIVAGERTMAPSSDKFGELAGWKGNTRVRGGRRRGRRSMRSRHKPAKRMGEIAPRINNLKKIVLNKNPRTSDQQEGNGDETTPMQVEVAENANSSESSEYDEDNGEGMGDEYYDLGVNYSNVFNGEAKNLVGTVDYSNVFGEEEDYRAEERVDDDVEDDDEDDNDGDEGDDVDEDELGDIDVEGYFNGDSDEKGNGGIGVQIRNPDEATGSTSSEYSD